MIRITLLSVGRTPTGWIHEGIESFLGRLKGNLDIQSIWLKDDQQLCTAIDKAGFCVLLDETGRHYASVEFSQQLFRWIEQHGSRLTLVVGGADGLPAAVKGKFPMISLSKMTLPHQMARLVLVEQLFRAWSIRANTPYHRN